MAIERALERAGLTVGDLELVELNEAFASVALIATDRLGVDPERVNINGGAIAHRAPARGSGTRILISLNESLRNVEVVSAPLPSAQVAARRRHDRASRPPMTNRRAEFAARYPGALILPYQGAWPEIAESAFIAPSAVVIGN
jgi:hypothetical protein